MEGLGFTDDDPNPLPETPAEPVEFSDVSIETAQIHQAAKESLDFLSAMCMPTVFKYLFPKEFKAIWEWLCVNVHKARDFSQLALGIPRGFAKTTFIKIFIIYVILFTKKNFILVICGTLGKAENIISDVCKMLSESNIVKVFGDYKLGLEKDTQPLKKFGFRGRTIILMAAGTDTDIRGYNLENERPDVMIFDDIQTREEADSDVVSNKLETWMYGTAMKAKSPHGCLFVFIANMYPTKWSILKKIKYNPTWVKFIVGGILADGTSLWEDLQPISQLLKEFENDLASGHPEIFFAEVLNDENASLNKLLDTSKIPVNPYADETIHQGNFIIIDPATDKTNADHVAIGYFELYDAKPVMKKVLSKQMSPGESIFQAIKWCLEHNCRLVAVESNAYQYTYLYWFNYICTQYGIQGLNCVPVYSGIGSKNSRIISMFRELIANPEPEQYLDAEVRSIVDNEVISFNPLKSNNTDNVLDLLTYSKKVVAQYAEFIQTCVTIEEQEINNIPVRTALETSPF